ncbi:MAG: response regulator transcription factor [Calditrichaeota bacterium]|nr:response regulator transcription factor [Calditrichota bacterium]
MYILIVEDEPKVADFLKRGLAEEGWQVDAAADGETALSMIQAGSYDVIALDIMLPGRDGLSVLRTLRNQGHNEPVLLLTARDAVPDRVMGLKSGADDYLVKPFAFEELLARLDALVRRRTGSYQDILKAGDLELDTIQHSVRRADQHINLTTLEFRLLEYLMRNKGRVLSRIDIEESIWGMNDEPDSNVVDVYINHLRKKIDKPFNKPLIHTIRGFGYKVEQSDEY